MSQLNLRYDRWIESLQNYTYQPNGMDQPTPTDTHRQNQAAALFEERKRHYEAQQLNYLRYIDKRNGRKMRSNSFGNGQVSSGQSPIKKHREINVPLPDYSPNMHRNDSFETRPPLRSALRSSRYWAIKLINMIFQFYQRILRILYTKK